VFASFVSHHLVRAKLKAKAAQTVIDSEMEKEHYVVNRDSAYADPRIVTLKKISWWKQQEKKYQTTTRRFDYKRN
jgi:hypothetical protein